MPTAAELALILRFRDQASSQLKQASQGMVEALRKVGDTMHQAGLQLRQLSRELLQAGLIITGPFVLAFHTAAERIPAVRDAVQALSQEFISFQNALAQAALPVLQELTRLIHSVREAFDALDPKTRDFIVRMVLLSGVIFLVSGTLGRLVADLVLATSNLIRWGTALIATQPELFAIALAIGLLITAFGGWENVALILARALDVVTDSLKFMADAMVNVWLRAAALIIGIFEKLANAIGLLPGKFGEMGRTAAQHLDEVRRLLDQGIAITAKDAATQLDHVVVHVQRGGGAAESFVRQMQRAIQEFMNAMRGMRAETSSWASTFTDELRKFWAQFSDMGKQAAGIVTGGITQLNARFAQVFEKIITQGGKAKDAFKAFGQAILETIAQMIAKFLAFATILLLINAIPGGTAFLKFAGSVAKLFPFQHGGLVSVANLPHYQSGGAVPIMAHEGEFVVNQDATRRNRGLLERINRGEPAGGQSVQNVFIINAIDEASFRGKLQQHADLIEAMFQRAIRRNSGPMREAVRI